nr:MAG TPA: hypothetical protein [Caudoviricetes sp.]
MEKWQIEKVIDKITNELIPFSSSLSDYLELCRAISKEFQLRVSLAEYEIEEMNKKNNNDE